MKADLLQKLSGNASTRTDQKLQCYDFLKPPLLTLNELGKETRYFYAHKKSNWERIRVGTQGRLIRFELTLNQKPPSEAYVVNCKSCVFVTFEVLCIFHWYLIKHKNLENNLLGRQ